MPLNLQDLVDGMNARMQRERAGSQLTLGHLIEKLEAMPDGAVVPNLKKAHSYRGYYVDLAFERGDGTRPAAELLAECRASMGKMFEGYKGGEFVMGELTPVWVAEYGCSGQRIIAIGSGNNLELAEDE